jgi:hypothetical protein
LAESHFKANPGEKLARLPSQPIKPGVQEAIGRRIAGREGGREKEKGKERKEVNSK